MYCRAAIARPSIAPPNQEHLLQSAPIDTELVERKKDKYTKWNIHIEKHLGAGYFVYDKVFDRPGVAGAVLQTASYLINWLIESLNLFLKYLHYIIN